MKTALVVIDVQKAMFAYPDLPPHDGDGVVARIAGLIAKARDAGTPVFFVQHDGGPDDDLHPGKPGFPFHDALAPRADDDVTVKHHGSAFHGTDLHDKLRRADVGHLVMAGMQSEYCVDAAIRGAVERGYRVTLAGDGHSTFDNRILKAKDIVAHQNETLNGSYARVVPAADITFGN